MKVFGTNVRLMIPVCLVVLFLCVSGSAVFGEEAPATTFTVTPSSLSFGVPTGSPASASQPVTVNVQTGSLTFSGAPTLSNSAFSVSSNSCTGTLTAPATCQINVVLTTSSTTLVTGTLTIPLSGFDSPVVNLSGAAGAIKLFDQTNVNPSASNASISNMTTINSIPLNLSCSTTPIKAKLSQSPDGNGDVLVDNYVTLTVNNSPAGNGSPAGNVCAGGVTDGFNNTTQQDCFSQAYRDAASGNQINGSNSDTLANPNPTLEGGAAGGVPPIDISSYLANTSTPQIVVTMLDAGGYTASSSLFLVTNCTVSGVTPGGTVSGNPITTDPNTQTQTLPLDTVPGQNILYTTSQANSGVVATGVTPRVTDIGISQAAFSALIKGTSAAPAVCLRLKGEQDPDNPGQFLCKGFLIQCFDPSTNTTTGDNCVTAAIAQRKLYDAAQFDSPDTPDNTNYLGSSCGFYLSTLGVQNGTCAPSDPEPNPTTLMGPGFLLGSDDWLNGTGCVLTGTLTGDVCPLDTLTQFKGAADPLPGSTTVGRNSVFVPVVNMPLPYTQISSKSGLTNNWSSGASTPTVNFTSYSASYKGGNLNPSGNSFAKAPIYSFTYGVTPAGTPIPDTTYPVAGDTTNYNTGVNQAFMSPICPGGTSNSLATAAAFNGLSDGIYNVHFFATDCAFTEELLFNPTAAQLTDATANWASFPVYSFGVDTQAPSLSCSPASSPVYNNTWYATDVTVNCQATDPGTAGTSGSGFAPAVNGIQGSLTENYALTTSAPANSAGPQTIGQQQVTDLAGNSSNAQGAFTFYIDKQAPTITGPTFSPNSTSFTVGQGAVTITYSCSDGAGSGVQTCSGTGSSLPPGAMTTGCGTNCFMVTFTPSITNVGNYSLGVSSQDNVGNSSSKSAVAYSIGYSNAVATVAYGALPTLAIPGTTLNLFVAAVDTTPQKSPVTVYNANLALTLTMPSNTLNSGALNALYATVTCASFPCTATPNGGSSCTIGTPTTSNGTTTVNVTCSVPLINDIFTSKSGVVVKVSLPIAPKASLGKTINVSGKMTAASPITGQTSFSTPILIL